jgi:hypothetical protein
VHSASRSISLGLFLFVVSLLVSLPVVFPRVAHADGIVPPGCSLIQNVIVCGGSATSGDTCITDVATGQQQCLSPSGAPGAVSSIGGHGIGGVPGLPAQTTSTGWLSRLTGWFAYALNVFFVALVTLLKDLVTYLLYVILYVVQAAINAIGTPSWLSQYSMGSILGNAGPIVGFFISQLQVGTALGLIGLGYVFRLTRKFLTLFQW